MKKALIFVVVFGAAAAAFLYMQRNRASTVDVTGPPGSEFTGTCEADGAKSEMSGTAPAHFEFLCRNVAFHLQLESEGMAVEFVADSDHRGKVNGGSPTPQYVEGFVEHSAFKTEFWINSSNRPPNGR